MEDFTKGYASVVAFVRGEYPDYEIMDAEQGLELEITAGDIRRGNRKDPWDCAVACSARRNDGADAVCVIRSTAILIYHRDGRAVRYQLQLRERKLIRQYDQTGSIAPQRFYLAPVWPTNRSDGDTAARRRKYGYGTGAKRPVGPIHYLDGVRNWRRPRPADAVAH